jgi:hypothetical protein
MGEMWCKLLIPDWSEWPKMAQIASELHQDYTRKHLGKSLENAWKQVPIPPRSARSPSIGITPDYTRSPNYQPPQEQASARLSVTARKLRHDDHPQGVCEKRQEAK